MPLKRFRVAEESMLPALTPGDEIVATDSRTPRLGELVVFEHPGRTGFWMVKRLVGPPSPIPAGHGWVMSDNEGVTLADSRTLGPVSLDGLLPVVARLDADGFVEGCELLAGEDGALASALTVHGIPEFWSRPPGLATLVLLILEQQVSLESGAAVFRRLRSLAGEIEVEALLGLDVDGVRSAGVTRQKAGYIVDLARRIAVGELDIAAVATAPTEEARSMLLGLRGVGPWTADAYLLSALGHTDVFPVGDRALQVGTGEVLGMGAPPTEAELEILSQPWRPLRAVAARIIWHAYLTVRGRGEPAHETPQSA
jgi:DNA-3-methyladenine glycosylase II